MAGLPLSPELRTRLAAIAAFADELESPAFAAGTWHDSQRRQTLDGEVMTMPWFELSDRATAFIRTAGEHGWIEPFDWMRWAETDEGRSLREDRAVLAAATPEQLQKLLTTLIRADRFNEGELEWAFSAGLIAGIARRAEELLEP